MSCCDGTSEFLKELDYIKHQMNFCGHSTDILQVVWSLRHKVKNFFPLNGVPQQIVDSLNSLEERFNIAESQLCLTCDVLIHQIELERNK